MQDASYVAAAAAQGTAAVVRVTYSLQGVRRAAQSSAHRDATDRCQRADTTTRPKRESDAEMSFHSLQEKPYAQTSPLAKTHALGRGRLADSGGGPRGAEVA